MVKQKKVIIRFFQNPRVRDAKFRRCEYDASLWACKQAELIYESKDTIVMFMVYQGEETIQRTRGLRLSNYWFDTSVLTVLASVINHLNMECQKHNVYKSL